MQVRRVPLEIPEVSAGTGQGPAEGQGETTRPSPSHQEGRAEGGLRGLQVSVLGFGGWHRICLDLNSSGSCLLSRCSWSIFFFLMCFH